MQLHAGILSRRGKGGIAGRYEPCQFHEAMWKLHGALRFMTDQKDLLLSCQAHDSLSGSV